MSINLKQELVSTTSDDKNETALERCEAVNEDGVKQEENEGIEAPQRTESSRAWLFRPRSHKQHAVSKEDFEYSALEDNESIISRSRSGSPFKKSFKSLFKRDVDSSAHETPKEEHVEAESHGHFWRSWRSRRHHNSELVETLRVNKDGTNIPSESKNLQRLVSDLADGDKTTYANSECDSTSYSPSSSSSSSSTTSSVERANIAKTNLNTLSSSSAPSEIQSAAKNEISPLTPLDDDDESTIYKKQSKFYRHVFEVPREYSNDRSNFDSMLIDKKSLAFNNLSKTLDILSDRKPNLLSKHNIKDITMNQVSNELLRCAKAEANEKEDLAKNTNELYSKLQSLRKDITNLKNQEQQQLLSQDKLNIQTLDAKERLKNLEKEFNNSSQAVVESTERLEDINSEIEVLQNKERSVGASKVDELKRQLEVILASQKKLLEEKKSIQSKYDSLQLKHKNLILDYEVLQEKHQSTTSRVSELANSVNKCETGEKEMRLSLEATEHKIQRYEKIVVVLKRSNSGIQESLQRERYKLLDIRREYKTLGKKLELLEYYKSESLQFMSYFMFVYRSIAPEEILVEYEHCLKLLCNYQGIAGTRDNTYSGKKKQAISESLVEETKSHITVFFQNVARQKLLDQMVAKHFSYMLSNNFLSKQLAELRPQLAEYEKYSSVLDAKLRNAGAILG